MSVFIGRHDELKLFRKNSVVDFTPVVTKVFERAR